MKRKMKTIAALLLIATMAVAETKTVSSPDGQLQVTVDDHDGLATYEVSLGGQRVMLPSALGLQTDLGDFSTGLSIKGFTTRSVERSYAMRQTKQSTGHYQANVATIDFENAKQQQMTVEFSVANNDVAFRYVIPRPQKDHPKAAVVSRETSAFNLPTDTRTFLTPQITPMTGWERTKPSYEEEYKADRPMDEKSQFGQGYTFPCLFRVPATAGDIWILISETGVDGSYVGSHLSDYRPGQGYTIAFPQAGENNGIGSATAGISLPYATPWRTITVGTSLKPIVETTVAYDLVTPKYEPSQEYGAGRYTWSWLIWQDKSINYDDQIQFIDLAAAMGYEYCLVDNWWDQNIGRDRMAQLSEYARSKGVSLMLWYNSNGYENDAPQTPRDCMSTPLARNREMAWMKRIGIKGIKVDFFGGDKQPTIQLYEDILTDANRYGLQCIFHGCTIPRGWEVMYPNYVASEAVLASENVYFSEHHAQTEAFELTMHPFCRNAVGTMDWGGTIMNRFMSRDNKSRHKRYTTDIFEMASAITNQTAIQCIAIQPNNLKELPQFELDFLKAVPTTWDETRFIDGYPGRYVVLARRHGDDWYVAGLNAEATARTLTVTIEELAGKTVGYYVDDAKKGPQLRQLKFDKRGNAKVTMQPGGGIIIKQ
jgi:hypothetical protein